jgi:hypothetical protein
MNDLPVKPPLYDVVTEIDAINDDRKNRIVSMIYGNQHIDHEGKYLDRFGTSHQLSKIHFTHLVIDGVSGAETKIAGVDSVSFDTPVQVYLEDDQGMMTGMNDAKNEITSEWRMGIILKDESGQGWFCGYDNIPQDRTTTAADAPILQKISLEVPEMVARSYGDISDSLPIEGEFHITSGETAVVSSIPWMSTYASTDPEDQATPEHIKYREEERAVVAQILERIATLENDAAIEADI